MSEMEQKELDAFVATVVRDMANRFIWDRWHYHAHHCGGKNCPKKPEPTTEAPIQGFRKFTNGKGDIV